MIGEANKERQTTFYYINAAADEKDGKQYTSKYHHASSQTTECHLFKALNHPPLQLPSGAVMKHHSIFTTWGCLTTYFTCKPPILMGRWRSSIGEPGHSGRFLHYHRANFEWRLSKSLKTLFSKACCQKMMRSLRTLYNWHRLKGTDRTGSVGWIHWIGCGLCKKFFLSLLFGMYRYKTLYC